MKSLDTGELANGARRAEKSSDVSGVTGVVYVTWVLG
jgi:hypothetical protein